MNILLVEDSKSIALPIVAFLERKGHRVRHASNGRQGVEAYRAETPDLVLMDVVMPEMDGIEATRQIKAMGGERWVPLMIMTSLSSNEELLGGLAAGADDYLVKPVGLEILEARIRSMQRIALIQDSLFGILDNVYEGIVTVDADGILRSFNKAAESIFGFAANEVIGRHVKLLMPPPYCNMEDAAVVEQFAVRSQQFLGKTHKTKALRKNGQVFPVNLSITDVRRDRKPLFIGVVRDISAEEAARARIEYMARHDALTGLPNRASLNEALDVALAKSGETRTALFFIDLDGFKPINDKLGHEAGDQALIAVAAALREAAPRGSFIGRLGGDEFVAMTPAVNDEATAMQIAQNLIAAISRPMTVLQPPIPCQLGASIGIAIMPTHGRTRTEILTAADDAMYEAKRAGKHQAKFASGESLR